MQYPHINIKYYKFTLVNENILLSNCHKLYGELLQNTKIKAYIKIFIH